MLPFSGCGGGGIGGGGDESGFWFEFMGRWERLGYNEGLVRLIWQHWGKGLYLLWWIANFSNKAHFFFLIPYMPQCQISITHHQQPW